MTAKDTHFATILKRIRKQRGLSQQQLADMTGVKVTQISRYEIGKVTPNLEMAIKLSNALTCSLDVFKGNDPQGVSEFELLAKKVKTLNTDKQKAALVLIKALLK
ncbi:MAG: helix-turn-helix domain-containing protein [Flavobacteriaceae bacterium]|nr:MAG: helix-turn-helix domain-containing protein [Flavobacteriaceae bacterium]